MSQRVYTKLARSEADAAKDAAGGESSVSTEGKRSRARKRAFGAMRVDSPHREPEVYAQRAYIVPRGIDDVHSHVMACCVFPGPSLRSLPLLACVNEGETPHVCVSRSHPVPRLGFQAILLSNSHAIFLQ